jgi:predicted nucleotidyltransferase
MADTYFPPIALTKYQISLIKKVVAEKLPNAKVFLFGSRINKTAKKYSDIDIAIESEAEFDPKLIFEIHEKLSDSFDFKVDLVDLNKVSEEFRKVVDFKAV